MKSHEFVLDSLPIIAYLKDEKPTADAIEPYLDQSKLNYFTLVMSLGNWIEVLYVMKRNHVSWSMVEEAMEVFGIKVIGISEAFGREVAHLKADYPIALGDSFAAALAWQKQVPLITIDPEFKSLEKKIKIIWLNQ